MKYIYIHTCAHVPIINVYLYGVCGPYSLGIWYQGFFFKKGMALLVRLASTRIDDHKISSSK